MAWAVDHGYGAIAAAMVVTTISLRTFDRRTRGGASGLTGAAQTPQSS